MQPGLQDLKSWSLLFVGKVENHWPLDTVHFGMVCQNLMGVLFQLLMQRTHVPFLRWLGAKSPSQRPWGGKGSDSF